MAGTLILSIIILKGFDGPVVVDSGIHTHTHMQLLLFIVRLTVPRIKFVAFSSNFHLLSWISDDG